MGYIKANKIPESFSQINIGPDHWDTRIFVFCSKCGSWDVESGDKKENRSAFGQLLTAAVILAIGVLIASQYPPEAVMYGAFVGLIGCVVLLKALNTNSKAHSESKNYTCNNCGYYFEPFVDSSVYYGDWKCVQDYKYKMTYTLRDIPNWKKPDTCDDRDWDDYSSDQ